MPVLIDRIAVVVKHAGILGDVADGVVERARELGEITRGLGCELLLFGGGETFSGMEQELAGFRVRQVAEVGIGGALDEILHDFGHLPATEALVFSLLSSRKAASISPMEALRYE